uniref:Putative actin cytoskeleton-regulatory complex protein pan1 n=1 Tax=Lutzomyia longipalpis TaxID=7200 RepID=A0A7G3A7Q3_LUTLO
MGGCRCTFQTCENNSANSPNMHFFHFPAKKKELCRQWAKYANRLEFLDLPLDKLKNKVVCQMHFRSDNFMNYLQNSLVKTAYPTLMRFGDVVLDLEKDTAEEKEMKLSETNSSVQLHIPDLDEKEVASGNQQDTFIIDMMHNNEEDINISPGENLMLTGAPRASSQGSQQNYVFDFGQLVEDKPPPIKKEKKEPTILNATYQKVHRTRAGTAAAVQNVAVAKKTPRKSVVLAEFKITPRQEAVKEVKTVPEAMRPDTTEPIEVIPQEIVRETVQRKEEVEPKRDAALETMAKELGELKQMVIDAVTTVKNQSIPSTSAAATSRTPSMSEQTTTGKMEKNMGKLQLFNAIKRYLNPSMVALLRMEMFGGMDREWKEDEKEFAVELYNLGINVYEFMRDEWRFRLPPEKMVKEWAEGM